MTCQSQRCKKIASHVACLPSKKLYDYANARIFLMPPTLTSHSFAAPWAMIMNSRSFENPKHIYLHLTLKTGLTEAFSRYIILSWKVPIHYINRALMILNRPPPYNIIWTHFVSEIEFISPFSYLVRRFEWKTCEIRLNLPVRKLLYCHLTNVKSLHITVRIVQTFCFWINSFVPSGFLFCSFVRKRRRSLKFSANIASLCA